MVLIPTTGDVDENPTWSAKELLEDKIDNGGWNTDRTIITYDSVNGQTDPVPVWKFNSGNAGHAELKCRRHQQDL